MLDAPHALLGLIELVVAFVLALPIGWEREQHDRSMGIRTFPLIAVASCAFLVLAQRASPEDPGAWNRTLEGVATGVGFLGAGAIVKHGLNVLGTATAASVWMTAAMGAAAALGHFALAAALSLIGFATLRIVRGLTPPDQATDRGDAIDGGGRSLPRVREAAGTDGERRP